jgi:hypothetical protein
MQNFLNFTLDFFEQEYSYQEEKKYLYSLGCKKVSSNLCMILRQYRNDTSLPSPRLEDLIRYHFIPCDLNCPYYIELDYAMNLLLYTIKEWGKILSCSRLYSIILYDSVMSRYPTETELFLFEINRQITSNINHLQNEFVNENEEIKHIPEPYILTKHLESNCCMCQEGLYKSQQVITLACLHTFHTESNDCIGIEKWFETSNNCPLCKEKI